MGLVLLNVTLKYPNNLYHVGGQHLVNLKLAPSTHFLAGPLPQTVPTAARPFATAWSCATSFAMTFFAAEKGSCSRALAMAFFANAGIGYVQHVRHSIRAICEFHKSTSTDVASSTRAIQHFTQICTGKGEGGGGGRPAPKPAVTVMCEDGLNALSAELITPERSPPAPTFESTCATCTTGVCVCVCG